MLRDGAAAGPRAARRPARLRRDRRRRARRATSPPRTSARPSRDMTVIAEATTHVSGLAQSRGGSGDPSPVHRARRRGGRARAAASARSATRRSRAGRSRSSASAASACGSRKLRRQARREARRRPTSTSASARRPTSSARAGWRPTRRSTPRSTCSRPCALGGVLNEDTVPRLQAPVIVGAANNQLADDAVADHLAARGILWAPDFVANAGGIINISVSSSRPATTPRSRAAASARSATRCARSSTPRRAGSRRSRRRWSSRGGGWRSRTRSAALRSSLGARAA